MLEWEEVDLPAYPETAHEELITRLIGTVGKEKAIRITDASDLRWVRGHGAKEILKRRGYRLRVKSSKAWWLHAEKWTIAWCEPSPVSDKELPGGS